MVRLTSERRAMLVDKVPDLANVVFASTVFGQLLGDETFSLGLAIAGVVIWTVLMMFTFVLAGGT